jgi:hypothetical protein
MISVLAASDFNRHKLEDANVCDVIIDMMMFMYVLHAEVCLSL